MNTRVVVAFVAAAALGVLVLVVDDAAMASPTGDARVLYLVFGVSVLVVVFVGWWLRYAHRRLASLRWTILVVAVAAVAVVAGVVTASSGAMFLDAGDLQTVLAALLLGTGLGVVVAINVTGPLTSDLRKLASAARRVADGDLTVETAVERADEVGALAASLDRMVEQLARLQDQRDRDEQARRTLLSAIGHDLRTPLASLQAAVEALQDGVAPDVDRYLRAMGGDVASLRVMVDDLFMLAQLEAGALELEPLPVDLGELVDSAVETITPLAVKHAVDVTAVSDGNVALVRADPRAMDRVLRNLLDNAVRHAPDGSTVRVEVRTGHEVTVQVHDEGGGFPEEFTPKAFERFTRADASRARRGGGAGLGLAIAKELVEAHDGRIWIADGPGAVVGFALASLATVNDPSLRQPPAS